jgi:hypothetical protein
LFGLNGLNVIQLYGPSRVKKECKGNGLWVMFFCVIVSHLSLHTPQVQVVGSDEEEIQHIYQ